MGRQGARWVIAAAVLVSGCIPRAHPDAAPADGTIAATGADRAAPGNDLAADVAADDQSGAEAPPHAAPARPLTPAERQIRELEAQLAERDRTIAAVQTQLANARRQSAPDPSAQAAEGASGAAMASASSRAGAASTATAGAADGAGDAMRAALAAKDAQLAEAQQQIATLESRLVAEIQRREQVEGEMKKVLEETSSGPFERSDNVVDQHLRDQLASARQEIAELRATIATERRERSDLERRYAALQQQLEHAGRSSENDSDEIAALKERQRRVLASIQQDLAASRQRESELRAALAQQDGDAVSLADSVTSLRAENAALQRRLDDEHRQNRELASKLKLAGRVTDLIFKMQSSGATTASSMPQ